ncbi:MAG: hypothetical protein IJL80_14140 [Treponema sp.]|nr:hypothetical protein [Treponema sp.]
MMKDKTALSTRKTGISYLCIGYAISLLFSGFSGLQYSVSGMKDLEAGIFAEWIEYVKGFRLNGIAFPAVLLVFPLSTVITALPPITLTYLALEVFNRVSVLPRLFPDGGIFSVRRAATASLSWTTRTSGARSRPSRCTRSGAKFPAGAPGSSMRSRSGA